MTDVYAVIGNPIGHSKSPLIHLAYATQTGQDIDYIALDRTQRGNGCAFRILVGIPKQVFVVSGKSVAPAEPAV